MLRLPLISIGTVGDKLSDLNATRISPFDTGARICL